MDQRRHRYQGLVRAIVGSRGLSNRRKNLLLRDAAFTLVAERHGLLSMAEADAQYDSIAAQVGAAEAAGLFRKQVGSKRFRMVLTKAAREMKVTLAG